MMRRLFVLLLLVFSISSSALAESSLVIVKVEPGWDIQAITKFLGVEILDSLPDNTYLLKTPNTWPTLPAGIAYAEPNMKLNSGGSTPAILSTGSHAALDWYRSQPAMQLIKADAALKVSRGRGIVIADINSAVDYAHPALIGHLTSGYDFVTGNKSAAYLDQSSATFLDQSSATFLDQSNAPVLDQASIVFLNQSSATFLDQSSATFLDTNKPAHGHGTLCAGVLAALAPDAMIMPLRAFDDNGNADLFTLAKAVWYASDHGAKVINMSFGTLQNMKTLQNAVAHAISVGVTLVASAGNANSNVAQYPAAYGGVMAIASTDNQDKKASFSNYNPAIYLSAPGVNIVSTYPGGYYALVSGTSFSGPIVAAEVALVRSLLTGDAGTYVSRAINIDNINPQFAKQLGFGRVDLTLSVPTATKSVKK